MTSPVSALVGLHVTRLRKLAVSMVGACVVMAGFYSIRHPITVDGLLPWFLGGAMFFPLASAVMVAREKADGSLRYFASLPVTGAQHAAARAWVVSVMSLPGGALVAVALTRPPVDLPLVIAAVAGAGASIAITALALVFLAVQIVVSPGDGARYMILGFVGLMVTVQLSSVVGTLGMGTFMVRLLGSPIGLGVASAALWLTMGVASWVALKVIGSRTIAYCGERVDQP